MRDIGKRAKATMIGISESKLHSTVLDPEIYIQNYEILCFGRNQRGEVLLVKLEVTLAINKIFFCQIKLKISHLLF